VAARMLSRPLANRVEHISLYFQSLIAKRGMVERPKNVIDDLVDGNTGIFPGVQNTTAKYQYIYSS
jgi:hypothetical protein